MGELESIEDVLLEHAKECDGEGCEACECGWSFDGPLPDGKTGDELHAAHLADAIRAHLAEVAGREEVREAMVHDAIEAYWTRGQDLYYSAVAAVGAYLQAIGDEK